MKKFCGLVLAIFLLGVCVAKAQDNSNHIALSAFSKIVTSGNVQLVIVPDQDNYYISVDCQGIKENGYKYRVRKDVLYIKVPTGLLAADGHIRVYASSPTLSEIIVDGAEVETASPIRSQNFSVTASGVVNNIRLWVEVENLKVNIGGNSDVAVTGKAQSANFSAQLGSRINAISLSADSVWVRANEGSEVYLNAQRFISAKAATGGTVYYKPSDAKIYTKTRSAGQVKSISRALSNFRLGEQGEINIKQQQEIERLKESEVDIPVVKEQSVKQSDEEEDFF